MKGIALIDKLAEILHEHNRSKMIEDGYAAHQFSIKPEHYDDSRRECTYTYEGLVCDKSESQHSSLTDRFNVIPLNAKNELRGIIRKILDGMEKEGYVVEPRAYDDDSLRVYEGRRVC